MPTKKPPRNRCKGNTFDEKANTEEYMLLTGSGEIDKPKLDPITKGILELEQSSDGIVFPKEFKHPQGEKS